MSSCAVSSLESHPCATSLVRTFFAGLQYQSTPEDVTQFILHYRAVLRFMSILEINRLRKMIPTPAIVQILDHELTIRAHF